MVIINLIENLFPNSQEKSGPKYKNLCSLNANREAMQFTNYLINYKMTEQLSGAEW